MRLYFLSTLYKGNIDVHRYSIGSFSTLSYEDHISSLIQTTTEFVGSYVRTFRKLGHDVGCSIANYDDLQEKWKKENDLRRLDEKQILFEQIKRYAPDVLWIDNIYYIEKEWLKKIRNEITSIRLILCCHCAPFPPGSVERLGLVDFVITCTPGLKEFIEKLGYKAYLVYHGFDTDFLKKLDFANTHSADLVFTGSLTTGAGFHPTRIQMIEKIIQSDINISLYVNLEKQYRITAKQTLHYANRVLKRCGLEHIFNSFTILNYGSAPIINYSAALRKLAKKPVFGMEMLNLLKSSAVTLNFHGDIAGNYAGNMRMFEATGVGSCLLTDNKANINELFIPDKDIMVYDSIDDCIDKAGWLLENESERRNIAIEGQKKTLLSHTVEHRCHQIIGIIETELSWTER